MSFFYAVAALSLAGCIACSAAVSGGENASEAPVDIPSRLHSQMTAIGCIPGPAKVDSNSVKVELADGGVATFDCSGAPGLRADGGRDHPGPCLGEGTDEMEGLLPALSGSWAWKGTRREQMRKMAGLEHVARYEDIQPVTTDSLCSHALGLIRQMLGERATTNGVALVRIGDRYVARYNYFEPAHGMETSIRIYFDEKFEQIKYLTG